MWNDLSCCAARRVSMRSPARPLAVRACRAGSDGCIELSTRSWRTSWTALSMTWRVGVRSWSFGRSNPAMPRRKGDDCNDWERFIFITRDAGRRSNTARCRRLGWRRCRTPPEVGSGIAAAGVRRRPNLRRVARCEMSPGRIAPRASMGVSCPPESRSRQSCRRSTGLSPFGTSYRFGGPDVGVASRSMGQESGQRASRRTSR